MHAYKLTAVMVAAAAAAILALATAPSEAQTTTAQRRQGPIHVAATGRPPTARLTVRKRSYLEPGTETKARAEHRLDYAFPPGNSVFMNSTLFNTGPSLPIMNNRMPFPTCFDLPGFCR